MNDRQREKKAESQRAPAAAAAAARKDARLPACLPHFLDARLVAHADVPVVLSEREELAVVGPRHAEHLGSHLVLGDGFLFGRKNAEVGF